MAQSPQVLVLTSGIRSGEAEPLQPYVHLLESAGLAVFQRDSKSLAGPIVFLLGTGGTEGQVLSHLGTHAGQPVWLLAHPDANSLPAALEVLARLQQDGHHGRIFYLRGPDDHVTVQDLMRAFNAEV